MSKSRSANHRSALIRPLVNNLHANLPRGRATWRNWNREFFLTGLMVGLATLSATGEIIQSDLCIFGGSSAGVIAAVQAAKLGKSVSPGLRQQMEEGLALYQDLPRRCHEGLQRLA